MLVSAVGVLSRLRGRGTMRSEGAPVGSADTFPRKQGRNPTTYNLTRPSRSALPITLTELSAIAAAAIIGDSSQPVTG